MIDDSLLLQIRTKASNPKTRLGVQSVDSLPAPASEAMIEAAERSLGFSLHADHRNVLMNVANGGFGPSYGMLGVDDGRQVSDPDSGMVKCHTKLQEITESRLYGLAPLCNWGASNFSLVAQQDGFVYIENEGDVYRSKLTLEDWLKAWVNDINIPATMFETEQRVFPHFPVPLTRIVAVKGEMVWKAPTHESSGTP